MARVAGRFGRMYVQLGSTGEATPAVFIKQWSLDSTSDRYDVTAQGDGTKVYVAGLSDAQGKYTGFLDVATAQMYQAASDGLARKVYLYPDQNGTAGTYWYGTAFLDFSVDVPTDGPAAISGTFSAATSFQKSV